MEAEEFKRKIADIYRIAGELGKAFKIDTCTPDGHLLGAIGQIAAKIAFGLELSSEKEEHNSTWSDGLKKLNVQVRCSGRGNIALREEPEHLIALEIGETGSIRLLFNGPGHFVWRRIKHHKNPQKYASSKALIEAQKEVNVRDQIPIVENIFDP
jgi:hypothetical protein